MSGSIATPRALPPLHRLALRFALVGVALLGIAGMWAPAIVAPMVPVLGRAVAAATADFTLLDVTLDRDGARPGVVFRANLRQVALVGSSFVHPMGFGGQPEGWYQVRLTTGGILQHALLLLIIVLAWPGTVRELALRGVLAVPLAALLVLQHVVVTVLAELWFPLHDDWAPGETWPLLVWSRFLMGGGGLMVAMVLAGLCIALPARLLRHHTSVNAPSH
jgi:hypothetical protein